MGPVGQHARLLPVQRKKSLDVEEVEQEGAATERRRFWTQRKLTTRVASRERLVTGPGAAAAALQHAKRRQMSGEMGLCEPCP